MTKQRKCGKCGKSMEDPEKLRGPRRKYHVECRKDAYKKRDLDYKKDNRNAEKFFKLLKNFDKKTLKELTKYFARSLRDSIYYSAIRKQTGYKSDYKEVQELIDLINEMIGVRLGQYNVHIEHIAKKVIKAHESSKH